MPGESANGFPLGLKLFEEPSFINRLRHRPPLGRVNVADLATPGKGVVSRCNMILPCDIKPVPPHGLFSGNVVDDAVSAT